MHGMLPANLFITPEVPDNMHWGWFLREEKEEKVIKEYVSNLCAKWHPIKKKPNEKIRYFCQQIDFIDFSRVIFMHPAHHTSSRVTELFNSKENSRRDFSSHHAVLISGLKSVIFIARPLFVENNHTLLSEMERRFLSSTKHCISSDVAL